MLNIPLPNEAAAAAKAENILNNRSVWHPLQNCADATQEIMEAGGYDFTGYNPIINTPGSLLNFLSPNTPLVSPIPLPPRPIISPSVQSLL